MEWCRSGHNGADSKSVGRFCRRHVGSNPTHSAIYINKFNIGGILVETDKMKQKIKLCFAIIGIAIAFAIVGMIMIKYEVEGDKNMPYNLSKIMIDLYLVGS